MVVCEFFYVRTRLLGRWKLELIFRGYFFGGGDFFLHTEILVKIRERDVFVFFRLLMLIGLCGVGDRMRGVREAVIEKDSGIFRIFYCIFLNFKIASSRIEQQRKM
jgi:hypothetical protein